VQGSFPARPKHSEGGLRQPLPTNKKINRLPKAFGVNKLPLQSLPQETAPSIQTGGMLFFATR